MARVYTEIQNQFKDFKEIIRTIRNVSDMIILRGGRIYLHSVPETVNRVAYINRSISISAYDNIISGPNKLYEFLMKATKTGVSGRYSTKSVPDKDDMEIFILSDDKKEISIELETSNQINITTIEDTCYKYTIEFFEECLNESDFHTLSPSIMSQMYDDMSIVPVMIDGLEMGLCKSMFPLSDINTRIDVAVINSKEIEEDGHSKLAMVREHLPMYQLCSLMRFLIVDI